MDEFRGRLVWVHSCQFVVADHRDGHETLQKESMSKNRKSQSVAIGFGRLVKALLLCVLLCGAGVIYVWQKDQIDQLAKQIKVRELRLNALLDQNDQLRTQLAKMRRPEALEQRIKELNLGLAAPQPGQVRTLPEPVAEVPRLERERQFVARDH